MNSVTETQCGSKGEITVGDGLALRAFAMREAILWAQRRLQAALALAELAPEPDSPGGTVHVWDTMRALGLCERTLDSVADALHAKPADADDPTALLDEAWEVETGPGLGVGPDALAAMTLLQLRAATDRAKIEAAARN